jgi:p-hydroxybenzoate 3-monooxygenase
LNDYKSVKECCGVHDTQVVIIGGGPGGLMVGSLLYEYGIDSIILERNCQSDVESQIRAGVLEQSTVDLLDDIGVSDRLFAQGFVQRKIIFQFDGKRMSLPIIEMTEGKTITIYGQHYLLQDLIKKRLNNNQRIWFNIENVVIDESTMKGK